MRILSRPVLLLLALLLASFLAPAAAGASHLRGAMIWWCPNSQSFNPEIRFFIEVFYHGNSQPGSLSLETFHFGDGTSEDVLLTTTEVYRGDPRGWYVARGEVEHTYTDPGLTVIEAGLETCCRIDEDFDSFGLNNRSFGNMTAKVIVDLRNKNICAPAILNPEVEWRSGTLGDTFEIAINNSDHNPRTCRIATEAEAGGGPHPEILTIDPDTCVLTWTPTSGDPARFWTTQVRVTQANVGESTFDFLLGLDADRPACQIQRVEPGPPTRLHVLVHDPRSGLETVAVTEAVNTTVEIPPFAVGDAAPLTVIGTKIDQSASSRLQLRVRDAAGNQTDCDPVLTEVVRATGQPESHTYGGIPPEERLVTVLNGDPGLRNLAVEVNGRKFQMAGLKPGEERTLDVGSAIVAGASSTFTLTAQGQPGGSAVVMIWDGAMP
jgi:Putative Ig domain